MAPAHTPWPIYVRRLEVIEAFDVSPGMRRVVLGGEQLGAFTSPTGYAVPPFRTENADDHVKLVFPDPAYPGLTPPVQADGVLEWTPEALACSRDYTPRRFDAEAGRLEVDFVRHPGGLAASWADQARGGDILHVAGPRGSTTVPKDVEWFLLLGDETALPAIARRIEELADAVPVTAVVSVPSRCDVQDLPSREGLAVTWVVRDEHPGADLIEVFARACREAPWRTGQVYAWAAGEAGLLRPIRRWLRTECEVDRAHLDISGYWRAGARQDEIGHGLSKLEEMADLALPYALRAAVSLRLAEQVTDGRTRVEDLARAVGADPRGVLKLLRVLAHEGLFTLSATGEVGLTPFGGLLTEDETHEELDTGRGSAHLDTAWPGLLEVLRTGRPGYDVVTGTDFWRGLSRDEGAGADFDQDLAGWAQSWAPAVARAVQVQAGSHVADIGGGTGTLLTEILKRSPSVRGTLVDLPPTAARARDLCAERGVGERVTVVEQSFFEPLPTGADVYLLAQVLHDWPDVEAAQILAQVAAAAGGARILVIERLAEEQRHHHDFAFDLQMYATFGSGERTRAEYAALAAAQGLHVVQERRVHRELFLLEFAATSPPAPTPG